MTNPSNSMENQQKALVCTGFHRSATSVTAQWLANSNLPMGIKLMGGNITNNGGHYEDWLAVEIHDHWLKDAETSWQFHDEVTLTTTHNQALQNYIDLRFQKHLTWGVKDPRACLFLNEWQQILGERGCYLIILRHWAYSIESLLHRHSLTIAYQQLNARKHHPDLAFWESPTLAARMWLAYYRRLLSFIQQFDEQSLVITQRSLFNDFPLIGTLNQKFGLQLNEQAESPINVKQLNKKANHRLLKLLPQSLILELELTWQALLEHTEHKMEDESPRWQKTSIKTDFNWNDSLKKVFEEKKSSLITPSPSKEDPISLLEKTNSSSEVTILFKNNTFNFNQSVKYEEFASIVSWIEQHYKTNIDVNISLATWLQQCQQWKFALSAWQWCVTLQIAAPYMFFNIAKCYEELDNLELTHYFLEQAIKGNPNNPSFPLYKAQLLQRQGDVEDALRLLGDSLEKLPSPTNIAIALAYCDCLVSLDRIDEAHKFISKLRKEYPEHQGVLSKKINIMLQKDKKEGKQLYYEEAKRRLDKNIMKDVVLAQLLQRCGSQVAEQDLRERVIQHWETCYAI
jgi:tetratricopeptide (TPR) repeat protein